MPGLRSCQIARYMLLEIEQNPLENDPENHRPSIPTSGLLSKTFEKVEVPRYLQVIRWTIRAGERLSLVRFAEAGRAGATATSQNVSSAQN